MATQAEASSLVVRKKYSPLRPCAAVGLSEMRTAAENAVTSEVVMPGLRPTALTLKRRESGRFVPFRLSSPGAGDGGSPWVRTLTGDLRECTCATLFRAAEHRIIPRGT